MARKPGTMAEDKRSRESHQMFDKSERKTHNENKVSSPLEISSFFCPRSLLIAVPQLYFRVKAFRFHRSARLCS